LIATYQSRAERTGADPLGYYVAPLAYAQLQVLERAIRTVGSTEDAALSDYTPRLRPRIRRHDGLEWFERVGYIADIAGLEREFGRALTKLPEWVRRHAPPNGR